MRITGFSIVFLVFLFCSVTALAQINVGVYPISTVAQGVSSKYGINVNAGVDHDTNRIADAQPLTTAIKETGATHLRYPGGEKSNYFVWTADPLNPDPATNYWTGWYNNATERILNFDEFMTVCSETGAEAHINVAVSKWSPDILNEKMAAEWVRYSNITKGYGVKYWEIGNEMWHPDKKAGYDLDKMVDIVKLYSNAMKAVDSTIKIGVSWRANEMQQLINRCGSALDFVSISNYTNAGGTSYSNYKERNNVDLLKVDETLSLKTVISEFNQADWSGSSWDLSNNTGKGLINFDLIGQILKSAKTEYGCMWNTRWFPGEGVYDEYKWDAFDNQNNPLPVVQPWALWHQFLNDNLVQTMSGDPAIVVYASYDNTGDMSVFLINKETSAKHVNLKISSRNNYGSAEVWQYKGTDEWDENPTIGQVDSVAVFSNLIDYRLPSTSITVFKLDTTTITSSNIVNTAENITIYPNPVTGNYLHINLNSSNSVSKVEIYDVAGRQKFAKNAFNKTKINVDVSTYQEGIYYVRIHNQEGIINTKIMVM